MAPRRITSRVNEIYEDNKHQVFVLHTKVLLFDYLFGDAAHVNLLNECAPGTFSFFLYSLLDDINLIFTRVITDRAFMNGRQNINFDQLISRLDPDQDQRLVTELTARLEGLRIKCSRFQRRRNRRISHRDLMTFRPIDPDESDGISRADMRELLVEMDHFLEAVHFYFFEAGLSFNVSAIVDDADRLLKLLAGGLAASNSNGS